MLSSLSLAHMHSLLFCFFLFVVVFLLFLYITPCKLTQKPLKLTSPKDPPHRGTEAGTESAAQKSGRMSRLEGSGCICSTKVTIHNLLYSISWSLRPPTGYRGSGSKESNLHSTNAARWLWSLVTQKKVPEMLHPTLETNKWSTCLLTQQRPEG